MADEKRRTTWTAVPDYTKIEEHGATIDAPTPMNFVIDDPWLAATTASSNGASPPASSAPESQPAQS